KAAILGELRMSGFDVPEGFVVTADAYRATMSAAGVDPLLDYPVALCGNTHVESEFRTGLVAQVEVPRDVEVAIGDAYRELGRRLKWPNPLVAVRASFVGENAALGPTAPALTGVAGVDGVIEGVRSCWRALFNEQAMITRAATRQTVDPAMAVIVQELVPVVRA